MCTFHCNSDSFKQRLKNHPLLHALCTNAHRILWLACMGNFRGAEVIGVGVDACVCVVTSLSE